MTPAPHFTWMDFVVLLVYFTLTMGIGVYFYLQGKSRSTEGYMAAGRSLPGIVVGLSILATYLSSISFLALPGGAYARDWNFFVFSLSLPMAGWIAVMYFLPFYRLRGEVSAYHHLEMRFGPWARLYAGAVYLVMQVVRIGAVTYLMALPLKALLGWDIWVIILITGISVIFYSLLGGLVGVIWTDAVQSIVLMVGALLCLGLMMLRMPEGPGQLFAIAAEHDKFNLGSFGLSLNESTFWVVLIYGFFINLTNFGIDQNYVQRYAASKSDREATKSLWLGALLYIPVSALFFLIGTSLFAFYTVHAERLPEGLEKADDVFPFFIVSELPPGLTGLLIAAIFAAAMSTTSTSLNSAATISTTDIYKRYLNPAASERGMMGALYVSTLIWGILGTLIAIALIRAEGILDAWWTLQGIMAGGMLGLFLLGMISRLANNPAAVTGVIAGLLVITWMSIPSLMAALPETMQVAWQGFMNHVPGLNVGLEGRLEGPFHRYLIIVFGTLTILLVGMLMAMLLNVSKGGRQPNGAQRSLDQEKVKR